MDQATIAEEYFARLIALWHGQKIIYRHPQKGTMTVASMAGYDSGWGWEVERYVDNHWQEYLPAAKAIIEAR